MVKSRADPCVRDGAAQVCAVWDRGSSLPFESSEVTPAAAPRWGAAGTCVRDSSVVGTPVAAPVSSARSQGH